MPSAPWPAPPTVQPRQRSALVLATLGTLLGIASMVLAIMALTRPPASPTYSDAQRLAAKAVVLTYENLVVDSSSGRAGDSQFDSAVDAVNANERVLKELCGD